MLIQPSIYGALFISIILVELVLTMFFFIYVLSINVGLKVISNISTHYFNVNVVALFKILLIFLHLVKFILE